MLQSVQLWDGGRYALVMETETPISLAGFTVAGRPGECPKCGHDSIEQGEPVDQPRFRSLLHLRPAKARCRALEPDYGGISTELECGCKNAFHGS